MIYVINTCKCAVPFRVFFVSQVSPALQYFVENYLVSVVCPTLVMLKGENRC